MGKWNDLLAGGAANYDENRGGPEYYEDKNKRQTDTKFGRDLPTPSDPIAARQYQNVVVYEPSEVEDVERLLDFLKRREPAIINLDGVEPKKAQRILDFVAGGVYALSGSIYRLTPEHNFFLLSPQGVEITIPYKEKDGRREDSRRRL